MAGEKRFGTSLFGFKKSDVNLYIEKILTEFDGKLKDKDNEINALKNQGKDVKIKLEELLQKSDQINEDRTKIAEVLIKAQEKANTIIEDARIQAVEEKNKLEGMVELEKEKLVDMKAELKALKSEVVNTLKKYEGNLSDIIIEEEE
jgi:hypothetical protein